MKFTAGQSERWVGQNRRLTDLWFVRFVNCSKTDKPQVGESTVLADTLSGPDPGDTPVARQALGSISVPDEARA